LVLGGSVNEESRRFLADLQGKLSQYFSGEEIETLAFVLGIDYDSLRGDTKPAKVNALLLDVARRGMLEELIEKVRQERGNVAWPHVPPNFELPQSAAGGETDGATIYHINTLNTAGGAFIGGGVTAGDEVRGSKYVFSGDFRGALLNIESRLERVTQSIGAASAMQPDKKEQLTQAVAQLKQTLSHISPEQSPDAEALTRRVAALTDEALAANPDREMVTQFSESVRRAAGKLAVSIPGIAALIDTVVGLVESILDSENQH
jgi:hypothetical protein